MKASFLDLRRRPRDVLRAMENNETVTLTYRGKDKGVIIPVNNHSVQSITDHPAFGIWKDRKQARPVHEVINELRKGRPHAF